MTTVDLTTLAKRPDWSHRLPDGWRLMPLKHAARGIADRVDQVGARDFYVGMEDIASWMGKLAATSSSDQRHEEWSAGTSVRYQTGDVLFGKLRPYLAKSWLADRDGFGSSEFLVLRSRPGLNPRFLLYFVLSKGFVTLVNASTYGAKMPRADWGFVGGMAMGVPPTDVQDAIVGFLDEHVGAVDEVAARLDRQIEALESLKRSVIENAIGEGADRNTWQKLPLKRLGKFGTGGTPKDVSDEHFAIDGIPWVKPEDLIGEDGINAPKKSLSKKVARQIGVVPANSIMVCGIGGGVGKFGWSSVESCCNQQINYFVPKSIDLQFAVALFSHLERPWLSVCNKSTIEIIPKSAMENFTVYVPCVEVQKKIGNQVGGIISKMKSAKMAITKQMQSLHEYRATLITSAVTGRIDVTSRVARRTVEADLEIFGTKPI